MFEDYFSEDEEAADDFEDDGGEEAGAAKFSGKNYITPTGLTRLKSELHELLNVERPKVVEVVAWAASNGDRSENADYQYGKRRLREIDKRIHFLQKRLDASELVDPSLQKGDKVLFGATVTVVDEDEKQRVYQIVGIDETDIKAGKISWRSPIGSALLQNSVGDVVTVKLPAGEEDLEIIKVEFK